MKTLLFIALYILSSCLFTYAENNDNREIVLKDSLTSEFETCMSDSLKYELGIRFFKTYNQYDFSYIFIDKAIEIAKINKNIKLYSDAYFQLARILISKDGLTIEFLY